MKYGKIRVEDGSLLFTKHMVLNSLPCKDIVWAYMRRESEDENEGRQMIANYLMVLTKRKKRYKFDMSEKEAQDCIRLLRVLNPEMAVGFPKGGRVHLQSLPNTRDLGALSARDGRHILPRKLLRSGDLYHLSIADKELFADEYHLKTVIDFRSPKEREARPDTIMAGVEYYHIPILDEETVGISRDRENLDKLFCTPGGAEEFMKRQYEYIIRDQYSVKQYARFIDVLLRHKDGAVLWHCSSGKDRSGIGTVLLLSILGIPKDVIREDYMRSNRYLEGELRYMERLLEATSGGEDTTEKKEKLRAFFQVREEYIDIIYRTIDMEYGSMEKFQKKALYLTPKAIGDLRDKYLL